MGAGDGRTWPVAGMAVSTMRDWAEALQQFVDGITSSVAVVGRDADNELVVTACNEHFFEMIGGRRVGGRMFPFHLDAVVPSYARHELRSKILECLASGAPQEIEQAYDLRDGSHWWRLSLKPLHHLEAGRDSTQILITGLDITPKMLLTHELEVSTSRFRSVVDAAYDAIITIDQSHRITLFNRAAERLFGYDQAEMIGRSLEILVPDGHRAAHQGYVDRFAHSPVRSRQMDERNLIYGQHRDGSKVPVEIAISKISVNGLVEFTAVIRDITDRVHLMELLQRTAATDELTGLPNRREFTDVAGQLMRAQKDLSLFILDVDHFKRVNDTYGHDVGDEVLKVLSRVSVETVRHKDMFARLGGEEFVAVLPDADAAQAEALAERLRGIFERQAFEHAWKAGQPVPFTVSIGVATRTAADQEIGSVLKRADQALYRAKEAGRNRVACG
ncbi:sensor domain-containing diguanylate cyclase [Phenylobacterium sp.]|uniref:sensor domain-containing diguanylate cyclase n=1 Tax=Phenylobacterium sp. TaxID=1871053 RepID=UPI0025E97BF9|nr:sensor domain-containing diguanylate cyclase [Phenylobacterium sp.]